MGIGTTSLIAKGGECLPNAQGGAFAKKIPECNLRAFSGFKWVCIQQCVYGGLASQILPKLKITNTPRYGVVGGQDEEKEEAVPKSFQT